MQVNFLKVQIFNKNSKFPNKKCEFPNKNAYFLDIEGLYLSYGPRVMLRSGFFGYALFVRYFTGITAILIFLLMYYERSLASYKYFIYERFESNWLVLSFVFYIILGAIGILVLLINGK